MTRAEALRSAARRAAASTGPWSPARLRLAAGAVLSAFALATWVVLAEPLVGGLLALIAFPGVGVVVAGIATAQVRLLAAALAVLGGSAGSALVVAGSSAATATAVGVGLVAVHELARWSVERRVDPPTRGATEGRRWRHLVGVLLLGWVLGAVAVPLAAGGRVTGAWPAVVGALAVVAAVGGIAAVARVQRS